jgi:hypothetical protein
VQKLLTTLLQSLWMVLGVKASKSRNSAAQNGPATPLSAFGSRNSHTLRQISQLSVVATSRNTEHPTRRKKQHNTSLPSSMAFFGLRKWPTPVSQIFRSRGVMYYAHDRFAHLGDVMLILPHRFAQVFRPLWPFFAASGITYYLVSKAQDLGVRCASFCLTPKSTN